MLHELHTGRVIDGESLVSKYTLQKATEGVLFSVSIVYIYMFHCLLHYNILIGSSGYD